MAALRRASRLLPRLPAIAAQVEAAQASSAAPLSRVFSTAAAAQAPVHIEEELYNRTRQLITLGQRVPTLAPDSWVAPNAVLVGDVDLYERASVWYGCVLRGDLNNIKIGAFSNVQDRTVIHAARSSPTGLSAATKVGRYVSIGQGCILRSAIVEDESVIGDKCILLEGSMVENHSVLAPGSVLGPGRRVPSGQLWAGVPAKYVRDLTKDEKAALAPLAQNMFRLIDEHSEEFLPSSWAYVEAEALRKVLRPESALVEGAVGQASAELL